MKIQLNTSFEEDFIKKIKIFAIHKGKNVNEIIEEAVYKYIEDFPVEDQNFVSNDQKVQVPSR